MNVKTFYWKGKPNFGDLLGPLLLNHFAGLNTSWSSAPDSEIVTVGSLLQILPKDYSGIIAGSGKLFPETPVNFPNAKIFSLRGPLTAKGVKGDFALGDPGIVANELIDMPDKEYALGILPHWSDTELLNRPEFKPFNPRIISAADDPLYVITEIAKCRKLVTSSLHGVILADSFGIPRRIEMAERFAREGNDFKFRDYHASINMEFEVGITRAAPNHYVTDLQHESYDVLRAVGDYMRNNNVHNV